MGFFGLIFSFSNKQSIEAYDSALLCQLPLLLQSFHSLLCSPMLNTAKQNGCFDLAVVILVAVLSDTQDVYQFRVGIGMLEVNYRRSNHVIIILDGFQCNVVTRQECLCMCEPTNNKLCTSASWKPIA